jgi:CDP-diacylglycerol--glycerol-3-phosphate 3-phosphatidyltransferase
MSVLAYWPNRITLLRLLGSAALFVLFALHGALPAREIRGEIQLMFWLFVVTAATDFLDGWLARRGNQVTAFGRIADPFCDKVLVVGTMVFLSVVPWGPAPLFPAWVVVIVLAREFLVTAVRGYSESVGVEFPADAFGKMKMTLQCLAIGVLLGMYGFAWAADHHDVLWTIGRVLVHLTWIVTALSGLNYVRKARHLLLGTSA